MACIPLRSSAVWVYDSQAYTYRKMNVTRERIRHILKLREMFLTKTHFTKKKKKTILYLSRKREKLLQFFCLNNNLSKMCVCCTHCMMCGKMYVCCNFWCFLLSEQDSMWSPFICVFVQAVHNDKCPFCVQVWIVSSRTSLWWLAMSHTFSGKSCGSSSHPSLSL